MRIFFPSVLTAVHRIKQKKTKQNEVISTEVEISNIKRNTGEITADIFYCVLTAVEHDSAPLKHYYVFIWSAAQLLPHLCACPL